MKKIAQIIFGIVALFAFVAATPHIRYSIYTTGTVAQVDAHVSSVSTNVATNGVLSFNTRTGAVVLASNDVVTALGYAPGTGSGSGITNGQSGVWFPSLSASNSLTIRVGHTNPTPVLNWARQLSLFSSLYVAGGLSWDTNDNGTFSFIGGHLAGDGAGLTNLNASALASGTVPLARLSGITSNQLDAATWLLATNTTPGWKLTEPGYVGGTNTFEPVYTVTQGTNLFIRGNTNSAADGLYTVQTNWTDGEATAYLYTNANADVIWSREVDLDRIYTFTNAAGQANFTEGVIVPTFQSPLTNTLSGGLCGTAAFGWTTNYTFGGFGVNGSTASDGAVLAFGQGLDYTTNGSVWTIYSTNITEACLSSNVWYWATNGGTGGNEAGLIGLTNDLLTLTTNAIRQNRLIEAWSTNYLQFGVAGTNLNAKTNVLGIWLTNGFASATWSNLGGAYRIVWSTDYTNWSDRQTNAAVAIGMEQIFPADETAPATQKGMTNLVIYTWSDPALFRLTNDLTGQLLEVDSPKTDRGVVPKKWLNDTTALRVRETNKLWAVNRAVRRVDLEGWPLDLDSQFELVTDRSQSNYFAVNLLDTGDVLAQWRSTNAPAYISAIKAGVWTELSSDPEVWGWSGTNPVTLYVNTNGLTAAPRIEYATNFHDPQWRPVLNVTNSYPDTTNDCYVVRFEPPSSQAAFRASVKGGKALEVFGDVTAETFTGDGSGLTNLSATNIVWDGSEYNFNAAIFTNIDHANVSGLYADDLLDVGAAAYFDGAAWFTNGLTSYGDVTLSGAGSDLTVGGMITVSDTATIKSDSLLNFSAGTNAGLSVTTGSNNTAVGSLALRVVTNGYDNTAVGKSALESLTSGTFNVAVGKGALGASTTGQKNVAIGNAAAGLANITGWENICVGFQSAYRLSSGIRNSIYGANAAAWITTGANNIAIGYGSGGVLGGASADNVLVGNYCIGRGALVIASNNVALGNDALSYLGSTSSRHNVAIGNYAGTGDGSNALNQSTNDAQCVFIGGYASRDAIADQLTNAVAIGYKATVGASSTARIGGAGDLAMDLQVGKTVYANAVSATNSVTLGGALRLQPGTMPEAALVNGGAAFWNSNSVVYILTSTADGTAWASTNKLAP